MNNKGVGTNGAIDIVGDVRFFEAGRDRGDDM